MLNIKGKYISLSVMSIIFMIIFIMAVTFSCTGEYYAKTTPEHAAGMDSTLKTAAGMWGMLMAIFALNAVMTVPAIRWQNKSRLLSVTLWLSLVAPLFTWAIAIYAIASGEVKNETATKKVEVTNG